MMNIRKSVLAVMIAGASFTGMAQAAGNLTGPAATASADVEFTQPALLTNTLTAVQGLVAGKNYKNQTVANGTITTIDGGDNRYAIRVSNGEVNQSDRDSMDIQGNNKPENKLTVKTNLGAVNTKTDINGHRYTISPTAAKSIRYFVEVTSANPVPADTYTIQTEAYIYTA